MKKLRCRDAGFGFNHEIHAKKDEEILQQAAGHVQTVHGLEVTPGLVDQVKKLIFPVQMLVSSGENWGC